MTKVKVNKICIIVASLGSGGAEKSAALLSQMLLELGYDIHIVSILDKIDYEFGGQLFNLGKLKSKDNSIFNRIRRYFIFKNYIKKNNFDFIIDSRPRGRFFKEFIISRYIYKPSKTLYCVRSFKTEVYINPKPFFAKLLYESAYRIVAVSHGISDRLKVNFNFKNLAVIHNPVSQNFTANDNTSKTENYILFYGRLDDEVKNIKLLLNSYLKSNLIQAKIKLKILGDGKDKEMLVSYTKELGINKMVDFLGFKSYPYTLVSEAYLTVLTSRYEGFPRVLVESLALGTPVVSVDCKSGPNEIIINEHNGLLVENYNEEAFTSALNRMVEDKKLYLHCKSNSKSSVGQFHKDVIAREWRTLLQ